jgi:aspartate/methionine/tyrosine aminotransferase
MGNIYALPDFGHIYHRASPKIQGVVLPHSEKSAIVTVPGKEFGMQGHIRPAMLAMKDIREGIERQGTDPTT